MTARAQTWDVLATVVAEHRYEDFSSFQLERDDESNYARLYVVIHAPNSYRGTMGERPDRPTRHEFMVPCATYDYANWQRWIYERLCTAAVHEVGEWFQKLDPTTGEYRRVFPPHHGDGADPYVDWTNIDRAEERASLSPGELLVEYLSGS